MATKRADRLLSCTRKPCCFLIVSRQGSPEVHYVDRRGIRNAASEASKVVNVNDAPLGGVYLNGTLQEDLSWKRIQILQMMVLVITSSSGRGLKTHKLDGNFRLDQITSHRRRRRLEITSARKLATLIKHKVHSKPSPAKRVFGMQS